MPPNASWRLRAFPKIQLQDPRSNATLMPMHANAISKHRWKHQKDRAEEGRLETVLEDDRGPSEEAQNKEERGARSEMRMMVFRCIERSQ